MAPRPLQKLGGDSPLCPQDVIFVICMSNKCGYLVRNGFVIYTYEKYLWKSCERYNL